MTHSRKYKIAKITDVKELAKQIMTTQTLCMGFEHEGVLFLNDSFTEDSAQEYAIVIPQKDGSFAQTESVTFSWIVDTEKVLETIGYCLTTKDLATAPIVIPVNIQLFPHKTCRFCE